MRYLLILIAAFLFACAYAQPIEQRIKVVVAPDHSDWTYKQNEKVKFTITVLQDGNPLKNVKVRWEYGPEKMTPSKMDSSVLQNGTRSVDAGGMKGPGFLRCTAWAKVDGKEYRGLGTAGFDPLSIKPSVENPNDFVSFWNQAKADLAKIPLDARMTLLPERCTETVNVYHVNIQNFRVNTRLYGILCVPKKEGKYPALLQVPGAGVRAYPGDIATAEKGIITLQIGIHGIPVTLDPQVYTDLANGALNGYPNYNMDNRDRYYFKRVYLGCVRANDFLVSLPQYDGMNLAVTGGSQGGALSIVTAALDERVKFLAAYYPAISDVTGYLDERAGGWPHMFNKDNLPFNDLKEKKETVKYYDVVNFARLLKVPGMYSWGYNDETCPPTSLYASYNVITAPKELYLAQETGHWTYPEQRDKFNAWLLEHLRGW
ncbi:MAG TPA: acetylxylan esterase [Cyclobacteriaceae bacterium]|nr:acetylxylan esterase [Cyclobacteriaceae bacterium]